MAQNSEFTCVDWFFFVVVEKRQKWMDEFNLESVFLSYFLKKSLILQNFRKPGHIRIYSFTILMTLSTFQTFIYLLIRLLTFWLKSAFWNVKSTFWHVKPIFWHVKSTFCKCQHFDCQHFDCQHFDVHPPAQLFQAGATVCHCLTSCKVKIQLDH